ncbi:MAG TPA: styrene monooxygenase/indole monooxygenase family protein [Gaiellaceae bacterium]|nr:styrene monooxygenase/indole monooxygenase family protein [Gaiellaceae bacterium]
MRRVAVVGAGQAGLQLALGLLRAGHEVTVVSNRTAEEIATGPVLSSQCMFGSALQTERALGLDHWTDACPPVDGISLAVPDREGGRALNWAARLDAPARSVDQRLKIPGWLAEVERAGGELVVHDAGIDDLELYARSHDLVVLATGKGALGELFARDTEKSPYARPQRALALTYVTGMTPRAEYSAVCFNLIPEVGEYFVFPALTTTGPCEIMVFEGVPGGPLDCWDDVRTPVRHLERSLSLLEAYLPWEAERCRHVELTDRSGILTGRLTPTVRRPVGRLPSGTPVLGMADAVVLNDPITGQGSNNAARCAELYLAGILEHGDDPFTAEWMQTTFDRYWRGYAQWVVSWTNALLAPPKPHVLKLLSAAQELPGLAGTIVNGFDDPRAFYPWWFDADDADRLIAEKRDQEQAGRFDSRDFRRALGQFATGVTVITTRTEDGRRVGVTANSFSSASLEPPLVLWCLERTAPSRVAFDGCTHFGVNVLAADQHHLSRQFSTPTEDKFAGVATLEGPSGVPLLDGALAHFICRNVRQIELGDHVIVVGEVERYQTFEGEPLVFHSGFYRVATRHPDLDT